MAIFIANIDLMAAAGGLLLFVAVFLLIVGSSTLWAESNFFRRRLASPAGLQSSSTRTTGRIMLEDGVLERFDAFVRPKNLAELTQIRRRLIQAGYRRPSAVRVFYASKGILAFAFIIAATAAVPLMVGELPLPFIGLIVVFAALIGFIFPSFWVERQIEYRRQSAELSFPDMLDMLLICMEAGSSLDQASRRVAREIKKVNKVLGDELNVVNDELYAGKSRAAVFRDFADRLCVPDISAFAAVLRQSDEFGVSVADTLRVYSSELRNKRVMRAEEKANMMPVKLALGSIAFTIPPTMLIMAGPSVIMILRTFSGLGGH
jgi:tight adherence protein C